jgi:hypothetical protein
MLSIFAVKLSYFVTLKTNAIAIKWPSLTVKNGKVFVCKEKSLVGLAPGLSYRKIT